MRVEAGLVKLAGKLLLQRGAKEVLDALGWFVQVVQWQLKVFAEISFPQPVGAHQRFGSRTARSRK